jgi:acyl-CoA thioesterase FadM
MGKVNKLRDVIALTGRMEVDYLRPVPLATPLIAEGWEMEVSGREHIHAAEIRNGKGEVLASSKGKFIEIDPHRMFAKYLKKTHSDAT